MMCLSFEITFLKTNLPLVKAGEFESVVLLASCILVEDFSKGGCLGASTRLVYICYVSPIAYKYQVVQGQYHVQLQHHGHGMAI